MPVHDNVIADNLQQNSSCSDAIEDIDAHIELHRSTIYKLIQRRNSLIPIIKVPDDIILDIFHHYQSLYNSGLEGTFMPSYQIPPFEESDEDTDHGSDLDFATLTSDYGWLNVAQVCRHWRLLALNTPSFWSRIETTQNASHIERLLSRSASAPLTIRFHLDEIYDDYSGDDPPLVTRAFFQSLSGLRRTTQLHVVGFLESFSRIPEDSCRDAPMLRRISLVNSQVGEEFLGPSFASYNFPVLTHLETRDLCLNTCISLFRPTVTHLYIKMLNIRGWHMGLLFDHLTQLSSLTTLCLDLASFEKIEGHPATPAFLPHLQSLTIRGWADRVTQFFHNLRFPPSSRLSLSCIVPDMWDWFSAHPHIRSLLGHDHFLNNPVALNSLECSSRTSGQCRKITHFIGRESSSRLPQLSLRVGGNCDTSTCLGLFPSHILLQMTSLLLRDRYFSDITVLYSLTSLHRLTLNQLDAEMALAILRAPDQEQYVLPVLKSLVLIDIDFSEEPGVSPLGRALVDILRLRREVGHGLAKLKLRQCQGWTSDDTERAKNVVDQVRIEKSGDGVGVVVERGLD